MIVKKFLNNNFVLNNYIAITWITPTPNKKNTLMRDKKLQKVVFSIISYHAFNETTVLLYNIDRQV